jgi:O-glycosyl hydrolase
MLKQDRAHRNLSVGLKGLKRYLSWKHDTVLNLNAIYREGYLAKHLHMIDQEEFITLTPAVGPAALSALIKFTENPSLTVFSATRTEINKAINLLESNGYKVTKYETK